MRVFSVILLLCLLVLRSTAQKETNQWFLHNNRISITPSGISNLNPTGTGLGFNPGYGSTSVSDAAGTTIWLSVNLVFFILTV